MTESEGLNVSARSISKSGRVLYAFSQFYIPFYRLNIRSLFDHYDIFGCVSAGVYEVDETIEAGHPNEQAWAKLSVLEDYIRQRLRPDSQVLQLFRDAREYYVFESRLRRAFDFSFEDLVAMTAKRSFDFRLMHRALAQLCVGHQDEAVFSWFQFFEILMEVEDDLVSAELDSAKKTFNILSLARCIAADEASRLVSKYRASAEDKLSSFLPLLSPVQQEAARLVLASYRSIVPRIEVPNRT